MMIISVFALKGELNGKILLVRFIFIGYMFYLIHVQKGKTGGKNEIKINPLVNENF